MQAAEEKTIIEVKPTESADVKSGSEVLRDMIYGQENDDGMTILFFAFRCWIKNV